MTDEIKITGWDDGEHNEKLNPVEVRDVTPKQSDNYCTQDDYDNHSEDE